MGPAHWDPKAISPFALPGVKKHRLFEELARRGDRFEIYPSPGRAKGPPTVPGRTHRPSGAA